MGRTSPNSPRWVRWLIALHLGVALGFVGLVVKAALDDLLWRADFTAFYTGGAIVRDGLGSRLYDLALQARVQQAILGPGRMFLDGVLPFNYPPHFALVMAPFSLLPLNVSFWCWTALQVGGLVWVIHRIHILTLNWAKMERAVLLSAFGAFFPILLQFLYGSLSLFVLLCLIEFYRALQRGRDGQAGFWLALAAVKPQAALFPVLILIGGRRTRAIAGVVTTGLVILSLSAAVLGPATWPNYLRRLRATSGYFDRFGVYPEEMINLKGTLTLWLGGSQAAFIQAASGIALLVGALAVLILWARMRWEPQPPDFDLWFSFTLILGTLLSPHLNQQDCLTYLLPVVLFLNSLRRTGRSTRTLVPFLLTWPALFLLEAFLLQGRLGVRLPVLLVTVLLAWMGWMGWKTGRPDRKPGSATLGAE